jgi:hypothetical protein
MLQNYISTIQADYRLLNSSIIQPTIDQIKNKLTLEDHVRIATFRIFATLGMGYSAFQALKNFVALPGNPASAITRLALDILLFTVMHEIFVLVSNAPAAPGYDERENAALARMEGKEDIRAFRRPLILFDGTLLKPVYLAVENGYKKYSVSPNT